MIHALKPISLPVTRSLTPVISTSLMVAGLMTVASLAGLLFPDTLYPSQALRQTFVSNDLVNLLLGLPILLGSMSLAQRGKLLGLLFWPGALLYVSYNYIASTAAQLFTLQAVLYLALVVLSGYSVYLLLTSMDLAAIQKKLSGAVPERLAGGVLAGFGLLFFFMNVGVVIQALTGQAQSGPETAVAVADLFTTPLWVIGGILLWRKQVPGCACGAGLLFQASMLFVGLLVFFILQPVLANTPFPMEDFIVIFGMGLIVIIPFGLFARAIHKAS